MKSFFTGVVLAFSLLLTQGHAEPAVAARIMQTRGAVNIGDGPAAASGLVKTKQKVSTGSDGYVLIGLAPGQYVLAGADTQCSITELTALPSDAGLASVVRLDKGKLHSTVHPPKSGTTSHKVITPYGDLTAKGTAWSTSVNGNVVVVSYSGAVTSSFTGLGDISLTPGSVATLTGAPENPVLTVVDLTTGRIHVHRPGAQVEEKLATAAELAAAAKIFEDGVPAFLGTASQSEQLALGQLIAQINAVLARNNVIAIGAGKSGLWPPAVTAGLTGLSGVASPESPN